MQTKILSGERVIALCLACCFCPCLTAGRTFLHATVPYAGHWNDITDRIKHTETCAGAGTMSMHGPSVVACPLCNASHVPIKTNVEVGVFAGTCGNCGHFFKFRSSPPTKSTVSLTVDGQQYTVGNKYGPSAALNEFLRDQRISMGTKEMCYEGGCGACLVQAKLFDPISHEKLSYAVNSCLVPLFACDGWEITTVNGIGNTRTGLHPIQKVLADYNGSQCGFCTPGQVMNMYALREMYGDDLTKCRVEDSFDGVICRCTGYRPILEAFKSLAPSNSTCSDKVSDIEDLSRRTCRRTGGSCTGHCSSSNKDSVHLVLADTQWFKPTSQDELSKIIGDYQGKNVRLLFGNTSTGVYRDQAADNFDVVIDLQGVQELRSISFDTDIIFGSALTLSNLVDIFDRTSKESDLAYLKECSALLTRVANLPVRNRATWTGNIVLKHKHPEFPSDVFIMLMILQARIRLGFDGDTVSVNDFMATDITGKVIVALEFKSPCADEIIKFYKVTPRAQNAHCYVTGGFRAKVDRSNNFFVKAKPILAYSGLASTFDRATNTENYLTGKNLGEPTVLKVALDTLKKEIKVDSSPVLASARYRQTTAMALFYKFVLHVLGDNECARLRSASSQLILERPISTGHHSYDTNKMEWPVSEPLKKLEADVQVSGEAEYIDDMPDLPGQLFAAFVLTTVGNAKLGTIDATEALKMPSVVKVITAKDIPANGENNVTLRPRQMPEELLCSDQVLYAGQAVAIVVAETYGAALGAAGAVKVSYTDVQPPILDIQDAIQKQSFFPKPMNDFVVGDADKAIAESARSASGQISCGEQYHFHMETQTSFCVPTEDGMDVWASTQHVDGCQQAIAQVLGIQKSSVNVSVKRCGGAFGAKIRRNNPVAAGCGLAAHLTNRPVKLRLDLHSNMKMLGKRYSVLAEYQVGFTQTGKLNAIKLTYYADCGCNPNETSVQGMTLWSDNAYYCPNWHIIGKSLKTNKPLHTAARSPGSLPAIFIMESIMEQVAKELGKDPTAIRVMNLYTNTQTTPNGMPLTCCHLKELTGALMVAADYNARLDDIQQFNKENRWKKKGISVVPLKFGISWSGVRYSTFVSVYAPDGTVAIHHGGIETGQGINTKVAQCCAYEFGIPVSMVKVKATNSLIDANCNATGGSITSEICSKGVIHCCQMILSRMKPVRDKMANPTWQQIVEKCLNEGVDLSEHYRTNPDQTDPFEYNSYGATVAEVELDILTGEHTLSRVDISFDCGQSLNPNLDVGQVEGAFVMGLGYWLTEEIKYDPVSGQLANGGTWEYKPPSSKDIPVDFRVSLLKNAPNAKGVLGSKAVGEPPMCMSCSALFALKRAIEAARAEIGKDTFFALNGPATVEVCNQACLIDPSQFLIQ